MDKSARERAEKYMDMMSGRHGLDVGISGDCSEICLRFVRLTPDRGSSDSEETARGVPARDEHLVFASYILCEPGESYPIDACATTPGPSTNAPHTMTQLVMHQLLQDISVKVKGKEKRSWVRCRREDVLSVMGEVKVAVNAMLDRIQADFAETPCICASKSSTCLLGKLF